MHEIDRELLAERSLDLFGFVQAEQSGVDEHACELVTDCLVHERGCDRGVDAARETADDPLATRPARISATACSMIDTFVHVGRQPAAS